MFMYVPLEVFSEDKFDLCIVIPFPENGKIVDTVVIDKTAFILVETKPHQRLIQAHFHIVPALTPLYADEHEYVGTFKMTDFRGAPITMLSLIRIITGEFGEHSAEYKVFHGTKQPEIEEKSGPAEDDKDLRKLWDITGWSDKTNEDDESETDSESE